jgi:hypothetical protein
MIGVGLALARSADAPLRSAVFIVIPLCSALLLLAAAAPFTDWSDWIVIECQLCRCSRWSRRSVGLAAPRVDGTMCAEEDI